MLNILLAHRENKGIPEKHLLLFNDYTKAFDCVDHSKLWKILKVMEYHTILPVSWETCMKVKKQQLETYMEQLTGSKLTKVWKAIYRHSAYLTSMQSIIMRNAGLDESQARTKTVRGNNNLIYEDDIEWQKVKRN